MNDNENKKIDLNAMENEGFRLMESVDNFYPEIVKSGITTVKCLYYNKGTKEVKVIETKTIKSKIDYIKEIDVDFIKDLDDEHPLKIALDKIEKDLAKKRVRSSMRK